MTISSCVECRVGLEPSQIYLKDGRNLKSSHICKECYFQ